MVISVKTEQPISYKPRQLSFADKEKLQTILDDLLDRNIIRPSNLPYEELNKIKDNFPSPLINDCLDRLGNKKLFTKLDLRNGITESSIKYTSFVTPLGQFEYLRMPFGLTNAPRVFQRYINTIFSDLIREGQVLSRRYFDRH